MKSAGFVSLGEEEAPLVTEMKQYRLPVCQEVDAIDRRWGKKVKSVGIWNKPLTYLTQPDLCGSKPPHSRGRCRCQLQRACGVPFNVRLHPELWKDQKDPHSGFILSQKLHTVARSAFKVILILKPIITILILPVQVFFLLK